MFISKVFKEKIKETGLPISEVATKSEVSEHYINSLIYNRVASPDMDKLSNIARTIGCKASDFMLSGETILEDLMLECTSVIKSTIQRNKLKLSNSELEESIKNAYDYAIKRKQSKKRPPLDDVFVKFFISKYQK